MSEARRSLLERLPALYRIRDDGSLAELLSLFEEQLAIVEESLEQLYDDLFVETCAEWVLPYIGDLIGYRGLHGSVPSVASPRAEVAHTIALRRRKGTASVLEQLARDVTGWNARAVEFFQLLAATQYMNHPRPHCRPFPDLRDLEACSWVGTAFDPLPRTVDVRRIEPGRSRHNIPHVGIFLWRIEAHSRTDSAARRAGSRQYRFSPLGHDLPLYGAPRKEDEITHLAEPANVPLALTRGHLARHLDLYYGDQADGAPASLLVSVDGIPVGPERIRVCDLSGPEGAWSHVPVEPGVCAVDPELGRLALPPDAPDPADVRVTWHEGFSADLGGGEYERGDGIGVRVPDDHGTLADALAAIGGDGTVVLTENAILAEDLAIEVAAGKTVEIRAANGRRPTWLLTQPLQVRGGEGSRLVLDGVLLAGGGITVPDDGSNALAGIRLAHCTLVPGLALTHEGQATHPGEPSLTVALPALRVEIERSILGGIWGHEGGEIRAADTLIDATDVARVALAGLDGTGPAGRLRLQACTVIGRLHAREVDLITDSILVATAPAGDPDWPAPVRSARRQVGCVRFSYLPFRSIVPRRYRCQPDSAAAARRIAPRFTSLHYGTPAYGQLLASTADAIRRGAESESEMGAFHHLYAPQREANLRLRLREYLRVGLEAGIFYES